VPDHQHNHIPHCHIVLLPPRKLTDAPHFITHYKILRVQLEATFCSIIFILYLMKICQVLLDLKRRCTDEQPTDRQDFIIHSLLLIRLIGNGSEKCQ